MPCYLDVADGRLIRENKKASGRTRKGYTQVTTGVWAKFPVVKSSKSYSLNEIIAWVNGSTAERNPGLISLFLCHISPSCPVKSLSETPYACRVNIDTDSGALLVWRLRYEPEYPDLVIDHVLQES